MSASDNLSKHCRLAESSSASRGSDPKESEAGATSGNATSGSIPKESEAEATSGKARSTSDSENIKVAHLHSEKTQAGATEQGKARSGSVSADPGKIEAEAAQPADANSGSESVAAEDTSGEASGAATDSKAADLRESKGPKTEQGKIGAKATSGKAAPVSMASIVKQQSRRLEETEAEAVQPADASSGSDHKTMAAEDASGKARGAAIDAKAADLSDTEASDDTVLHTLSDAYTKVPAHSVEEGASENPAPKKMHSVEKRKARDSWPWGGRSKGELHYLTVTEFQHVRIRLLDWSPAVAVELGEFVDQFRL